MTEHCAEKIRSQGSDLVSGLLRQRIRNLNLLSGGIEPCRLALVGHEGVTLVGMFWLQVPFCCSLLPSPPGGGHRGPLLTFLWISRLTSLEAVPDDARLDTSEATS